MDRSCPMANGPNAKGPLCLLVYLLCSEMKLEGTTSVKSPMVPGHQRDARPSIRLKLVGPEGFEPPTKGL